jgi:hypothetical protein
MHPSSTAGRQEERPSRAQGTGVAQPSFSPRLVTDTELETVEHAAIAEAILRCHGNLTLVAEELRILKSIPKYFLAKTVHEARAAIPLIGATKHSVS